MKEEGCFPTNTASRGKRVVIIDDVLFGKRVETIESILAKGGEVALAIVLVNKTTRNGVDDRCASCRAVAV